MKEGTLEFKCDCRYNKSELKYKSGRKMKSGKYATSGYFCPEHNKPVRFKISHCVDCGIEILNELANGRPKKRCKEHSKEQIKKQVKIQNHKKSQRDRAAKKNIIVKRNYKDPVVVRSIYDAERRGVPCIPLQKLFLVNRMAV